jgi:hypothetical protein
MHRARQISTTRAARHAHTTPHTTHGARRTTRDTRHTTQQLDALDDDEAAADNGGGAVTPTPLGRVASLYYLRHTTAGLIASQFMGQQLDHVQV